MQTWTFQPTISYAYNDQNTINQTPSELYAERAKPSIKCAWGSPRTCRYRRCANAIWDELEIEQQIGENLRAVAVLLSGHKLTRLLVKELGENERAMRATYTAVVHDFDGL
jgi:hypothetical protein